MWTRAELKTKGKTAFKNNYWNSVLVGIVALILTGAAVGSGAKGNGGGPEELLHQFDKLASQSGFSLGVIIGIVAGIVGISFLIGVGISLFLKNPLMVGVNRFFIKNADEPASMSELLYPFNGLYYIKIVCAKLLVDIFVALWSILFVIPGIIKIYQYRMVGYILADDPDMDIMEVLRESKEMMKGHKWNTFVLDLSFIGWHILNVFTLGILGVFYIKPYVEATGAELYCAIKQ